MEAWSFTLRACYRRVSGSEHHGNSMGISDIRSVRRHWDYTPRSLFLDSTYGTLAAHWHQYSKYDHAWSQQLCDAVSLFTDKIRRR
jgi:hypothetical protein